MKIQTSLLPQRAPRSLADNSPFLSFHSYLEAIGDLGEIMSS